MKRDRDAELHFFEWRLTAWATSETREWLNATGRGIYLELLFSCYAQGRFPDDFDWMCRRCACTREQLDTTWPAIARHFPISKEQGYRWNLRANIVRQEYYRYVERQRENRRGKSNTTPHKASEIIEMYDGGETVVETKSESGRRANNPNTNTNTNGNTTPTPTPTEHPPFVMGTLAEQQGTFLPDAPVNGNGKSRQRRKGHRTTEEVRAALGGRCVWFDELWKVGPWQDGKLPGMDAYELRVKDRDLAVLVYKGAKRYRAKCDLDPTMKIKFLQGWINDERWMDEGDIVVMSQPHKESRSEMLDRQAREALEECSGQ